jgi:lipopolysaccharide export LptBFGC system permease protein LptF
MVGELANRIIDPVILVATLVLFFALCRFVPRLGRIGSAILASLVSAIAFAVFDAATVPRLPSDEDTFFALLISAMIQCSFAMLAVEIWQRLRA